MTNTIIEYFGHISKAGRTFKFDGTDSQKLYLKNLMTNRKELEEGNWIDCNLEYKYNNYGFRSEEFDLNITPRPILFFGCSHTVGIGIHVEQTFPYLVSQRLNLPYYNLGVGGAANNTIFRLAHKWIPMLRPSKVVILYTHNARTEFAMGENNLFKTYLPNDSTKWDGLKYIDWYQSWAAHPLNGKIQRAMVTNALQNICKNQDAELYEFDIENPLFGHGGPDRARDLMHFGPKRNLEWTDLIIEAILNK